MNRDYEWLLEAILDSPQDDTPRLAMADWLEENDKEEYCDMCVGHGGHISPYANHPIGKHNAMSLEDFNAGAKKDWRGQNRARWSRCPRCTGEGKVPNGNAKLAEFIRVQIELANTNPSIVELVDSLHDHKWEAPEYWRVTYLRHKEKELWGSWPEADDVRSLMHASMPKGVEWLILPESLGGVSGHPYVAVVRRGFIDEVRLPLLAFGQYAVEIFSKHPVTKVALTDQKPYKGITGSMWFSGDKLSDWMDKDAAVPRNVYCCLEGYTDHDMDFWRRYNTEKAARDALEIAAARAGRQRARDAKAEEAKARETA